MFRELSIGAVSLGTQNPGTIRCGHFCLGRRGCFGFAGHDRALPALGSRSHHSLAHYSVLCRPACQRSRDSYLSPALLFGRIRQRVDSSLIHTADTGLQSVGSDRLWFCVAGPEWLEPVSAFPGRLDGCSNGLAVCDPQLFRGTLSQRLVPEQEGSLARGVLYRDRKASRFERPSEGEAGSFACSPSSGIQEWEVYRALDRDR